MLLHERLAGDLREALKAGQKETVSALRLLRAQLVNEALALRKSALSDAEVLRIVQREVGKRAEAAGAFRAGSRADAAAREEAEQRVLERYLPAQLSDADLERVVRDVVQSLGAPGGVPVGKVIGAVMVNVRGQADGTRVRAVVERILRGS